VLPHATFGFNVVGGNAASQHNVDSTSLDTAVSGSGYCGVSSVALITVSGTPITPVPEGSI